ncbi:MAG TPA: NADH-quinone oxidoreductase subunit N [Fluviicola sp.]|nr:NADH-quinone oxidoreductase subunit N [Fluviicola sp.]
MDALIVIFVSGLISIFAAFAKKPAVVLLGASGGLMVAIGLMVNQLITGDTFIQIDYEGLNFDSIALIFSLALSVFTLLIISVGYERFKEEPNHTGEYIGLLVFSLCGAMIMTAFTDMFMFFLGLEILSIPIYVMAGSRKSDVRSNEASLKYFLMGAFATGLLLFGIAWIYGATQSFTIDGIAAAVANGDVAENPILLVGILLILSSFVFKVGAAPFHFWSPDVYDGAPHAVTGFMASVVKMAAFAAFLKLFAGCFGGEMLHDFWAPALAVLAVITLFVGNLSALRQVRLKRLLAFSSITHVGYTLLVILSNDQLATFDLWFYMAAYGFSIIGIITVGLVVNDSEDRIEALRGLGKRNPLLAIVAVVSILSLAGIPPTAGFFGKYMVFSHAWNDWWWLVIIALINSAISIYYYLRMLGTVISTEETPGEKIVVNPLTAAVLVICLIGMLGLGALTPYLIG